MDPEFPGHPPMAPLMGGTSYTTSTPDPRYGTWVDGLQPDSRQRLRWVRFHVPAGVDPADQQHTYCAHDLSRNDAGITLAENVRERRPVAFYHPGEANPHPIHRSQAAQVLDPEAPTDLLDTMDEAVEDPCSVCGETLTVELSDIDLDGREQSITICAGCGSDQR